MRQKAPLRAPSEEPLLRFPYDHLPGIPHPIDRQLDIVDPGWGLGAPLDGAPIPERHMVTTGDADVVQDLTFSTLEDRDRNELHEDVVDLQADNGLFSVGTLLGGDVERDQGGGEEGVRGVLTQ